MVIERGGQRLLDHGTPYLSRAAISALPPDERLLAYLPYHPGMAVFGLPRAAAAGWWTDARVWFLLVTTAALLAALGLLHRAGHHGLVRAAQVATVLPLCALTLATGGDDLPVLALCLLACALAATGRWGLAGLAVGVAGGVEAVRLAGGRGATRCARPRGSSGPPVFARGALACRSSCCSPAGRSPGRLRRERVALPERARGGGKPRAVAAARPPHCLPSRRPGDRACPAGRQPLSGSDGRWCSTPTAALPSAGRLARRDRPDCQRPDSAICSIRSCCGTAVPAAPRCHPCGGHTGLHLSHPSVRCAPKMRRVSKWRKSFFAARRLTKYGAFTEV